MKNYRLPLLLSFFVFCCVDSAVSQINWEVWNKAEEMYQSKQYAEALNYFDEVERDNPYYGNTYVRKSYINYHLKNHQQALAELEQAYVYKPIDSQYFYMKGQFLDKSGAMDNALFYFDLLISMEPNNSRYRNYRGNIHLESQHFKSAIKDYNFVLAREPEKYNLYFSRGAAKFNLKMKREACLDWLYAREHNKSCQNYFFYKCNNEDLRPINHPVFPVENVVMPVCNVGNDSSLVNFISLELNYPDAALFRQEEGMVLLQFDITSDAKMQNIKVLHSVSDELDQEALRLIELTKEKWVEPAKVNGKPIHSSHILPISFRIEQLNFSECQLLEEYEEIAAMDANEAFRVSSEYLVRNPFAIEAYQQRQNALKLLGHTDEKDYAGIYKQIRSSSTYLHPEIISYSKCAKLFYNNEWELTIPAYASYYRLAKIANSLRIEGAYQDYRMDGTLYATGHLNYGNKDGVFQFYYPNGQLKSEYLFENDMPLGLWKFYYEDGSSQHLLNVSGQSFEVLSSFDSARQQVLKDGNGTWQFKVPVYNHADTVTIYGEQQNKLREGEWGLTLSNNISLVEKYKKGNYISGEYSENGKSMTLNAPEIKVNFLIPGEILKSSKLDLDPKINSSAYSNMLDDYRFEYVNSL
ncbi:TonB family protein [Carboxylicivirga mesophila]|uniref:TonB family protein n=1 Tax=Carboxylicivirga mesophila TaxID=1166478 RepID=A0ABS5K9N4_9BACT|nr:TonB family protein [Carboxylicivirga mesophila]MBS2211675.1 TonB family protein [Carboxylicivirga mesophila]